jgi:peptidyl-prolyl cis-trans isomerase SurA
MCLELLLLLLSSGCSTGLAEDSPNSEVVAATVGDTAIYVRDVQRELTRVTQERETSSATRAYLSAKALQQLVDREIILQWLERTSQGATTQEIDLEIARRKRRVADRGGTWESYLKERHLREADLQRLLCWQLGWGRFLQRHMDDANLERFFASHRRQFDGTRIRVAHILLRVESLDDEGTLDAAIRQADEIRRQITQGDLTFAAAAQEHSSAPSAAQGGDIGFIGRREPMPESFSRAAFALNLDELSPPVVTAFGVHLIQCREIEEGQRSWQEARPEIEGAVMQFLFQWAADRGRPDSPVHFSGNSPHFRPGTEEIVRGRQNETSSQ